MGKVGCLSGGFLLWLYSTPVVRALLRRVGLGSHLCLGVWVVDVSSRPLLCGAVFVNSVAFQNADAQTVQDSSLGLDVVPSSARVSSLTLIIQSSFWASLPRLQNKEKYCFIPAVLFLLAAALWEWFLPCCVPHTQQRALVLGRAFRCYCSAVTKISS